jgi:hypothetical protein
MVKTKLFFLFSVFYLALFFSSAHYGINAKAAGNTPPQSPPYAPQDTPLLQSSDPVRQCSEDACYRACKMNYFLKNETKFYIYMDTIRDLVGCGESSFETNAKKIFQRVAYAAGVETAAIMNCAQFDASVESSCSVCQTNIDHCFYAPNLSLSFDLENSNLIHLSNNQDSVPYTPNAITGGFIVTTTIKRDDWDEAIPFAKYEFPTLSYQGLNWASNPVTPCTDMTQLKCKIIQILASAPLTQDITTTFPNLFSLENLITSQHGNLDSDPADGYVLLLNDGDSVTLQPGLSGITFVREDTNWNGVWDNQYVEAWNSLSGEYTVSNAECKDYCWFGEQRVNRDKFVLVLNGPCESLLLGEYTLGVEAPLDHDFDISNNNLTHEYSIDSIPPGCGWDSISAHVEATLTQGPNDLTFNSNNREFVKYYRVVVPEDASLLEVVLEGPNSSNPNDNLDLLLRRGSAPETTRQGFIAYDYVAEDFVGYPDKLRVQIPEPGEWFIEVYHRGPTYTKAFHLTINIETSDTPIVDLTEGQYALSLKSGQTSQVFRLRSFSQLESMQVSFEPTTSLSLLTGIPKIYMCPERIPPINYEHSVFPGFVCGVAFNGQGLLHPFSKQAKITSPESGHYYILIERTNGLLSSNYNLNIDFTWPASTGLESEPNDNCDANVANAWHDDFTIPKRGYFYPSGDQDAYTFVLGTYSGGSTEMETYLASVPSNIRPDLIVYKKVLIGTAETYEEVGSDHSAHPGGSPSVRFDLVYGQEYCIVVRSTTQNQTDPYSLYIRDANLASTDETEVEPNNYPDDWGEQASTWNNMDNAMRGRWSPASDKDYFKWKAPSDGVYFLAVNSTPTVPTHTLVVFEQVGIYNDDQTPRLQELNRGHNLSAIDPVGLTFNATKNVNYYFELSPDPAAESDWYKLTLQKLDDYGATCSGAAMLNLSQYNPTSNMMDNLISSQLPPGDQDCFHIQPAIEGNYTLALPQSPDSISPLVELFSYNPNAFDFANETRTQLGQFAFTSGNGQNGEYTIELRHSSVQGLNYQVQGLTYRFAPNVGYCACISAGTPSGGNGQSGGSGGGQTELEPNGSNGDANSWDINTPMQGKLDVNLDVDIYYFTAPQSGIFKITLSDVPYNIEPDLSVFRSQNSSLVVKGLYNGAGNTTSVEFDANQGDIFDIKVKARFEDSVSDRYYSLTAKFIEDLDEPNNTSAQATPWNDITQSMHGFFYELLTGPADVYKFSVPQSLGSVLLTVKLTGVDGVQADMYIKNQWGETIVSNTSSAVGADVILTTDANPGEFFYVWVNPQTRLQVSDKQYTLQISTTPDPGEPNNTSAQATLWNDINQSMQGFFYELNTGPADVYKFSVPQSLGSVLLTVKLTGVAGVQADMYIKNQWGETIVSNTNSAAEANVILTTDANPGEFFYVWVNPRTSSQVSEKQYTLQISTTPDPGEPNDSVAQATGLNITGGPIKGYFFEIASGTGDYYKFTAPAGQTPISMTVRLTNVASNITPRIFIKTSTNSTVASNQNAGPGEQISLTFNAQPGAIYYVLVEPESTSTFSTQPYILSVAVSPK